MKNRDLDSSPKDLTQQDLFYREVVRQYRMQLMLFTIANFICKKLFSLLQVNRVSDIVPCLLECEKLRLSKQPSQEDHREIIMTVNTVLEVYIY